MAGERLDSEGHRIQCRATLSDSRAIAARDKSEAQNGTLTLRNAQKMHATEFIKARNFL
jgi:hypothetical protein